MKTKYTFISYIKNNKTFSTHVEGFNQIEIDFINANTYLSKTSLYGALTFSDRYIYLNYYGDISSGSTLDNMDDFSLLNLEYMA